VLEPLVHCGGGAQRQGCRVRPSGDDLVTLDAKPNFRALGKKFGKRTPLAAQAVAAFGGEQLRAFLHGDRSSLALTGSHMSSGRTT
jgi:isoleucyl-tRNA synthetase